MTPISDDRLKEIEDAYYHCGATPALLAEIARLKKECAMWRANHREMVARNQLLRDRPDLTAEQVAARLGYLDKVHSLQGCINEARQLVDVLNDKIKALCDVLHKESDV